MFKYSEEAFSAMKSEYSRIKRVKPDFDEALTERGMIVPASIFFNATRYMMQDKRFWAWLAADDIECNWLCNCFGHKLPEQYYKPIEISALRANLAEDYNNDSQYDLLRWLTFHEADEAYTEEEKYSIKLYKETIIDENGNINQDYVDETIDISHGLYASHMNDESIYHDEMKNRFVVNCN